MGFVKGGDLSRIMRNSFAVLLFLSPALLAAEVDG